MKLFLINFIIYVYSNYIIEDWSDYTKIGKFFIYPLWIIRSTILWIICPVFIPVFLCFIEFMVRNINFGT